MNFATCIRERMLAQSLVGATAFQHSIRDVFGEEAEVSLTLDDDKLVAEGERATMIEPTAQPPCESAPGVPDADRYALQGEGDLRQAELWVQVLTWKEMDDHGVLTWLDRETWKARRDQLEKLGGPAIPSER